MWNPMKGAGTWKRQEGMMYKRQKGGVMSCWPLQRIKHDSYIDFEHHHLLRSYVNTCFSGP